MPLNIQKGTAALVAAMLCVPAIATDAEPRFEVPVAGRTAWEMVYQARAAAGQSAFPSQTTPEVPAGRQQPEPPNAGRPLHIFVLVGEGAVNVVSSKSAAALVLEVRDQRNLPVEGAEVRVQLPSSGPGGFFPGHQLTWTGVTDANGQVVVSGFTPNGERGRFNIHVTARRAGSAGSAVIAQTNSAKPAATAKSKRSRWWIIGAVVAAGAAGGIVWAVHDSGGKPTVVLQPGTVSIGTPR